MRAAPTSRADSEGWRLKILRGGRRRRLRGAGGSCSATGCLCLLPHSRVWSVQSVTYAAAYLLRTVPRLGSLGGHQGSRSSLGSSRRAVAIAPLCSRAALHAPSPRVQPVPLAPGRPLRPLFTAYPLRLSTRSLFHGALLLSPRLLPAPLLHAAGQRGGAGARAARARSDAVVPSTWCLGDWDLPSHPPSLPAPRA